jgi:pimeloyl-ACP methyl ester carboxylesterase
MKHWFALPNCVPLALERFHYIALVCILSACLFLAARPVAAAEEAGLQSFDSNGCKIHYTVEGKGEPVVLIHGLDSSADINWRLPGTIKMLAESYQVIAPDLRGHGHSGKPEKESDYGLEMVEDITRLLDHLKIERAHIVGYSLGGMIAVKFAVLHPRRVKSVVLGGMGWLKEGSGLQAFWGMIPDRKTGRLGGGNGPPMACMRSLGKMAVTKEEFQGIKAPLAILVGDRDPTKRLYVEPAEQIRPDLPVVIIEGAGHLNCIFKAQFKEELKKALDRHAKA